MNAALGIGKRLEIEAIADTILKRIAIDSTLLNDDQKQAISKGVKIQIISYRIIENHIMFTTVNPYYFGTWYAFAAHVQLNGAPKSVDLISLDQLMEIAPNSPKDRLTALHPHINTTLYRYNINKPLRIAHFIAQIAHESDGFRTNEEYASGKAYEWRDDLGNVYEGDGARYKGRGLIQVAGRFNYEDCSKALNVDLIREPKRLADDDLACLSAGWFWDREKLNVWADADNLLRITRIVNGGTNGLADRQNYLQRAKRVLKA